MYPNQRYGGPPRAPPPYVDQRNPYYDGQYPTNSPPYPPPNPQWPPHAGPYEPRPQQTCYHCGAFTHPSDQCREFLERQHQFPYDPSYGSHPAKRQKFDRSSNPRYPHAQGYQGPQNGYPPSHDYQHPPRASHNHPSAQHHSYQQPKQIPPDREWSRHNGYPPEPNPYAQPYHHPAPNPSHLSPMPIQGFGPQQHAPLSTHSSYRSDFHSSSASRRGSADHGPHQSPHSARPETSLSSHTSPVSEYFRFKPAPMLSPSAEAFPDDRNGVEHKSSPAAVQEEPVELEEGETDETVPEPAFEPDERSDLEALQDSYENEGGVPTDYPPKPPKPVGCPLPSILNDDMKIAPLPEPSQKEISSVSMFINGVNKFMTSGTVKQSGYWHFIKSDPIFRNFPTECESIAVEELKKTRGWRRPDAIYNFNDNDDGSETLDTKDYRFLQRSNINQPAFEPASMMSATFQPENMFDNAKAADSPKPPFVELTEEEMEAKLISLGVTGQAKPASGHRPAVVPLEETAFDPQYTNGNDNSNGNGFARDHNPGLNHHPYSASSAGHTDERSPSSQFDQRRYSQPFHQDRLEANGAGYHPPDSKDSFRRSSSDVSGNQYSTNAYPNSKPGPKRRNTMGSEPDSDYNGQSQGQITESPTSAKTVSPRVTRSKNKYETFNRKSRSPTPDGEAKRQEDDDSAPKRKKKAPKVEAAYSRRW